MPIIKTKRGIERQAIKAIHHPPTATEPVKVSKEMQDEKKKMVRELIPFLMYLYKKYMGAKISESAEGTDLDMLKLINKAMKQMPGSPAQKKTIVQLNKMRTAAGMKPLKEDINIPIKVGDTVLGGKFKNKRIVVKSIGKNEKGDITINGKPLLKYRILDEDLRKWFGKGKTGSTDGGGWDRYSSDGKKLGKCGDGKEGDAYAACLSKEKAAKLGPDGRASFVRRKRADQKKSGDTKKGGNRTKGKTPTFSKTKANESSINEIPMGDLQKIDQFADKKLNPVDVVLTDKHFFDRLNDPRNGKEISQAELIGFFKRLSKKKKEFVEFLNQYNSLVAVDDRTNINIPFMKQANKAIAKTVMRKKDFKTTNKKLDI